MKKFWRGLTAPYRADSRFVASADLMRIFCVFLIAWYHIWQQSWLNPVLKIGSLRLDFNPIVRTGYLTVDLLLMLSGFLLFLPYARHLVEKTPLPSAGEYYKKRAARILPSYLLCIFVILFCFALPNNEYPSEKHMWVDLLAHLTFTHNLHPLSYQSTHLNGVLWTLAVEVQFYLIAPLVCRAFMKKPFWMYLIMTGAAFVYRFCYVLPMDDCTAYLNRLPAMLDVYANGMMSALVYVMLCRHMRRAGWKSLIMTVIAVLCGIAIYQMMRNQSRASGYSAIHAGQLLRRFQLSAASAGFLVSAGLGLNWLCRLISSKPVRWLSMISFNVYIWHAYAAIKLKEWQIPPYTAAMPNQAGEQPWQTLYTWLAIGTAVVIGALVTYLVEKPCAWLILRPWRKKKKEPAAE